MWVISVSIPLPRTDDLAFWYVILLVLRHGALALIPTKLLTMEQIGIPASVRDLLYKPRGLVLVTGPTGSGKSTTLASMGDKINSERRQHIITIEDPIEYLHNHQKNLLPCIR